MPEVKSVPTDRPSSAPTLGGEDGSAINALRRAIRRGSMPVTIQLGGVVVPLEDLIGEGATAQVFRVVASGRPAAIKVLRPELTVDEEVMLRFANEVEAMNELRHPAVPEFLGHGFTSDNRPFAAFAFVEGESLRDRIRRAGRMVTSDALIVLDQILDVLVLAHQRSILHRDLKPGNVMLTPEGMVVVLDFGLAKMLNHPSVSKASAQGMPLGTPSYMAPEQARPWENVGRIGPQADLFGAAITAVYCMLGENVRKATGIVEQLVEAAEPVPSVTTLGLKLPAEIQVFLDRALAYSPQDRFESADQMQRALRFIGRRNGVILPSSVGVRRDSDATAMTPAADGEFDWVAGATPAPPAATAAPEPPKPFEFEVDALASSPSESHVGPGRRSRRPTVYMVLLIVVTVIAVVVAFTLR